MSFVAAVDHLHALGHELAAPTEPRRKFELDHMRILAHALGDPQLQFPAILIAGTNGKGSTGATLAAILAAAGYRTGLYTSPHLTRITERIRVSGPAPSLEPRAERVQNGTMCFEEIPEPDFARLYFRVDDAARQLVSTGRLPHHPSFFESLTALAFLYFAEQKLDIAILEVGLGGRLDATNIVDPLLSIITDIALDHQEYLGTTIAQIAREKAGILRAGGTLITLPQHPEANQAIGEAAIALNVHAISATDYLPDVVRSTFSVDRSPSTAPPSTNNVERTPYNEHHDQPAPLPLNHYDLTLDGEPLKVLSPLPGRHQQRNIALAIAAAVELRNYFSNKSKHAHESSNYLSYKSTESPEPRTSNHAPGIIKAAIEEGIASTHWPGRLEFLPPNLLLDVAHNPAGAWTLRAAIATLPEDQPRTLIFSCLRDKDLAEMSQILFPLFDSDVVPSTFSANRPGTATTNNVERTPYNLILTPIQNPRAASLDDLLAAARALSIPAHAAQSPTDALALARRITPPNGLILATGSIYLIGALREALIP